MAGLERVDVPRVLRHVAETCARHPQVLAAHVFGSALGDMRPDSDIDVRVVLWPDAAESAGGWGIEGELDADLGRVDAHPCQVTLLPATQAIFAAKVLGEARVAYVADADLLSDFLEHVARLTWQNGWRYWAALREVNGWDPRPTRAGRIAGRARYLREQLDRLRSVKGRFPHSPRMRRGLAPP